MLPLYCDYVFKNVMRTEDYLALFNALLEMDQRPPVVELHREFYSCANGTLLIGQLQDGTNMAFGITFSNDEPVLSVSRQLLTSTYYHYCQLNLKMPLTQLIINNYLDVNQDEFYLLAHTLRSYPEEERLMDVWLFSPLVMQKYYEQNALTFDVALTKWLFLLAMNEHQHCPFHLPGDFLHRWRVWGEDPYHEKCFRKREARIEQRIANRLSKA